MKCPKCNSNIEIAINVQMVIPGDMDHKITKVGLRRKEVQLWGASWDRATYTCRKCEWIDRLNN